MIKRALYIVSVIGVFAISMMILLNGLGLVEYRLNSFVSYISRGLIVILVFLFGMAIVNVRKNTDTPEKREGTLPDKGTAPVYSREVKQQPIKYASVQSEKANIPAKHAFRGTIHPAVPPARRVGDIVVGQIDPGAATVPRRTDLPKKRPRLIQ